MYAIRLWLGLLVNNFDNSSLDLVFDDTVILSQDVGVLV